MGRSRPAGRSPGWGSVLTNNALAGLLVGTFLIAFGAGHANGARGRTLFPAAWIDGLVLAFVGFNLLIFSAFGLTR